MRAPGARDQGPDLTPPTARATADPHQVVGAEPQAAEPDSPRPAANLPSLAGPGSLASTALSGTPPSGPPPRKPTTAEDPLAPLGVRLGVFLLRPAIEVFSGYETSAGGPPRESPHGRPALWLRKSEG
jgi:hypothetical protein